MFQIFILLKFVTEEANLKFFQGISLRKRSQILIGSDPNIENGKPSLNCINKKKYTVELQ